MDLAKMYEEHVSRVYGFFAYRLRPGVDAEDLTATTFERAMRHADRYDSARASQATWLLAIAQNTLVDHYRRNGRRREEPLSDELLDHVSDDGAFRTNGGLDPALETALDALGERERLVVALRYGAELRGKEIASIVGTTEANVHQILSRSLKQLRRAMPPR